MVIGRLAPPSVQIYDTVPRFFDPLATTGDGLVTIYPADTILASGAEACGTTTSRWGPAPCNGALRLRFYFWCIRKVESDTTPCRDVHNGYTEDAREVKIVRPASERILRGFGASERFCTTSMGCWLRTVAILASVRDGKKSMSHEILEHHRNSCLLQWNVRDSIAFRHSGTPRAVHRRLVATRTRCAYNLA